MKYSLFLDICRNDYRAILEMTRKAIELCPDDLWDKSLDDEPAFWQQVYHTVFYTDFYLSEAPDKFRAPTFNRDGMSNLEETPGDAPSKEQMLQYLEEAVERCEAALSKLTAKELEGENRFPWTGPTLAHRLIYNIRHSQHHVGWMNSILSRKANCAAEWIITAD